MTACSPRRASGQLIFPALGWALRDAQHRGGAVRTATSPGVWRLGAISSSPEALALPDAGLSHLAAPRGLQEPCWGAHAPAVGTAASGFAGKERSCGGNKKLSGGEEAGRRKGEQSDHLLKAGRVRLGGPGRLPQPPGVLGRAAKGQGRKTLQSRGWRPGMDGTVPSPSPRSPRAPQP